MTKTDTLKKNLLVLNPFPVFPPTSGGQERVFYLYKHVAEYYPVIILCFAKLRSYKEIAPDLTQITIPKSRTHTMQECNISAALGRFTCAITPMVSHYTPEYAQVLHNYKKNAYAVILSHPYLYDEVKRLKLTLPMIYDAHNVEYNLHRELFTTSASRLLSEIFRVEQAACRDSQLIVTCSQQDANTLSALYNLEQFKLKVIPNGADINKSLIASRVSLRNSEASQKTKCPLALFMGSNHAPNINAAQHILNMAQNLPNLQFALLGSLCSAFRKRQLPTNVEMLGVVTEKEKNQLLCTANAALNPMLSGSGTNIKMFDYMSAGIPIITTAYGTRGIDGIDGQHYIVAELADMPTKLCELLSNKAKVDYIANNAYCLIEKHFNWRHIAADYVSVLSKLIH